MRAAFAVLVVAGLSGACPAAFAGEGAVSGSAWVPYSVPSTPQAAPARKSAPEPWLAIAPTAQVSGMNLKPGGACGRSELEVCFDGNGRLTVPGAKRFLPGVPGLKPERLTVKRNAVIFGYSF